MTPEKPEKPGQTEISRISLPALFSAVADLSVDERARFYTDNAIDPEAQREIEELLAHDPGSDHTLSQIVGVAAKAMLHDGDAAGLRCGAFRLVKVLGAGGMGVVYLAERADKEVAQRAAVKLMRPGWNQIQRERFLRERDILAALTHPNIAHLLDAGHLPDGQPYLAMEYVQGKRIDDYCRDLTTRQKIELFLKVCSAVEYLHANFVLHRDLKPSNILVTAAGEPKLLDFGIAKIFDLDGQVTVTEARVLTPDYASPEQLSGSTLGPVSDIYSLGAVLHLLLTGSTASSSQPPESSTQLKGDLKLVLQTAMRSHPQDRYATVAEFAADLRACLESRPVLARRREWIYRVRKFARRQPVSVGLGAALALCLAVAAGLWHQQFSSPSPLPELRPTRLTSNTPDLPIDTAAISPDGNVVAYADSLGVHLHNVATKETRLVPGTSGHVLVGWTRDGSGLETQRFDESGALSSTVISMRDSSVRSVPGTSTRYIWSPDGKHRATSAVEPSRVTIEDADGFNAREVWSAKDRTLQEFVWSPDSRQIAVLSFGTAASVLETVDVGSGRRRVLVGQDSKRLIDTLVWPSPGRIVVGIREGRRGVNSQGTSNLWELRIRAEGEPELRRMTAWTDFPLRFGSMTTNGQSLAFIRSFRQRDVYVAELDRSRTRIGAPRRLTLDLSDDYPTAWTPDSKAVLFTSDRTGPSAIFRQYLDNQTAEQVVFGPESQIIARRSPDGKWVLFAGREGEKTGVMRAPMNGGRAELLLEARNLTGLRCSRVGPCTIAQSPDGAETIVSEIDPVKGTKLREIYRDCSIKYAAPDLSPDAKWLVTPSATKIIFRSFATGAIVREIEVQGATEAATLRNLDYAPDGKGFFASQTTPIETRQLYIGLDGKVSVLWRQAGKSMVWGIPSPDGRHLAMMVYTDDSNVYTIDKF